MTLVARPTTYNGIQMRSRLEARFAAFLDRAGSPWEYEPRAFASKRGQYLPDFRIDGEGRRDIYIEVKGPEPTPDDGSRLIGQMEIIFESLPDVGLGVVVGDRTGRISGNFVAAPEDQWRHGGFCMCSAGHVSVFHLVGPNRVPILWCQPETGPLDELRAYLNPWRQT